MAKNSKMMLMKVRAILVRHDQGTFDDGAAASAIMIEVLELAVADRTRLRFMLDALRELV